MAAQDPIQGFNEVKGPEESAKEYNIEFFPGKSKKVDEQGKTVWEKTGNIYWMYSGWKNGKRKRVSPTKKHKDVDGITKVENCPNKHRVREYFSRSSQKVDSDTAGHSRDDRIIQGRARVSANLHDAGHSEWGGSLQNLMGGSMVGD